jgi:hypothetical protein
MIDPDGQPEEQHPRPSHLPDIEYEDEPPGSYLGEFSVGTWKLCWSGLNILVVGLVAWVVPDPWLAEDAPALSVIWKLMPASCLLSLSVTLWLTVVGRRRSKKLVVLLCFAFDLFCLLLLFYPGAVLYEVVEVKDGGRLRVVAMYNATPRPSPRQLDTNTNAAHCRGKVFSEEVVVDSRSGGLRDVVVRLEGIGKGKAPAPDLVVTNRDCSFHPHVSAGMAGSLLKAANEDPLTHSTHPYYGNRSFFNYQFSSPGETYPGRKMAEPGLITVKCDVHNWMRAFVVVHDNPYIAVTDPGGVLLIEDIPPGEYSYVAWHEKFGESRGTVEISPRRESELQLDLGPGK